MTGVWRDCRGHKQLKQRVIDPALDLLDFQECLEHREYKETRVNQEKEAPQEHQESWDPLVSQVLRAHLAYLVSRGNEGRLVSQD